MPSEEASLIIEANRFPADIEEYFLQLMQRHGIVVELLLSCLRVRFPSGTTKRCIGLFVIHTIDYTLELPDGFRMYETEPCFQHGMSNLYFDLKDVPQSIRDAHPRGVHNR